MSKYRFTGDIESLRAGDRIVIVSGVGDKPHRDKKHYGAYRVLNRSAAAVTVEDSTLRMDQPAAGMFATASLQDGAELRRTDGPSQF